MGTSHPESSDSMAEQSTDPIGYALPGAPDDCPLSLAQQRRNILLYASIFALIYLGAPVLYVGMIQASLLDQLGHSKWVSNVPGSVAMWCTPSAVLIVWLLPYVRLLKLVVAVGFFISACMAGVVVVALILSEPRWILPAVILHGAVLSITNSTCTAFLWEILGRGVSLRSRGYAFALAAGPGAAMAVIGSLGSQWLLQQNMTLDASANLGPRLNYAVLYAAVVPMMLLATICATQMIVPLPKREAVREPFLQGVFGGFYDFITNRLIQLAVIGYLLVYAGYSILSTFTLYTETAVGVDSQELVGYQNALRFGFKVLTGILLGWLLSRSHPKLPLLATTSLCMAAVVTAILAPGYWFLLSFGIMGAGELFGLYFPNYVLCCSEAPKMRRNMAFCSLITVPAGCFPILYGAIIDTLKPLAGDRAAFQVSFVMSLVILTTALILIWWKLPRWPSPKRAH